MQKQQSPLLNENILNINADFYKGCTNEKDESVEIYRSTDQGFLVCVDNIVKHVSKSRRDALARYGEYFD